MKSLLDPTFRYVPSFDTNLRSTFARIRREMRKASGQAEQAPQNVVRITKKAVDRAKHAVGM